ncbi:MAG: hypothetical protein MZW92_40730 [Comamonadaceae bacterium]|nr:hypothetical protein [Comamonadaceae bacterium]
MRRDGLGSLGQALRGLFTLTTGTLGLGFARLRRLTLVFPRLRRCFNLSVVALFLHLAVFGLGLRGRRFLFRRAFGLFLDPILRLALNRKCLRPLALLRLALRPQPARRNARNPRCLSPGDNVVGHIVCLALVCIPRAPGQ